MKNYFKKYFKNPCKEEVQTDYLELYKHYLGYILN